VSPACADTDVLVVGAGPVGLALAIELGHRGVRCRVVEKNDRVGYAPRAKTTNVRTREHMRRWGIADRLRDASPFGIDYPSNVVFATSLTGHLLARFENAPCASRLEDGERNWLALYAAVARRDPARMTALADALLATETGLSAAQKQYLLTASLAGHLAGGTYAQGIDAWNRHIHDAARTGLSLDLRYLYAWLGVARTLQ